MAKAMAGKTNIATELPYAFISIHFEEAPHGRDTEAIIGEDGFVIRDEITGYYYADISYSDTPITMGKDNSPEVDDQVFAEVSDPLEDDDEGTKLNAVHEAAHEACWLEAKDFLRYFKYKEAAYFDRGVLNAEGSSGHISLSGTVTSFPVREDRQ